MDKVYLHSHCNISASVFVDGSQGLSRERNLANLYPPTIRLLKQRRDGNLEDHHEACQLRDDHAWTHNVTKSPINTRGWVFQEMLLAPRVLHFSHEQLFWECRQHRACEVEPRGHAQLARFTHISDFKPYLQTLSSNSTSVPSALTHDDIRDKEWKYITWQELVAKYSFTNLTKPLDKLIALSGVAKIMASVVQDTYIAGMWRDNLERDLLWSCGNIYDIQDPPKYSTDLYRAPSWSWASRHGEIEFTGSNGQVLLGVKDVFLQHRTEDITGHVTRGWLEIAGQLGPITLSLGSGQKYNLGEGVKVWEIEYSIGSQPKADFLVIPDELSTDPQHFDDDNSNGRLFFLPCLLDREDSGPSMQAMVLRVVDRENGVFERIGLTFGLEGLGDGEIPLLPTDIDEDIKANLPCLKYEDGKHTIRII